MEPLTIIIIALLALIVLRMVWNMIRVAIKIIIIALVAFFVIYSFYGL